MVKCALLLLSLQMLAMAVDLPARKYLNLTAIKALAAGAEAEMQKRNVFVTLAVVDEGGTTIFLQKADGVSLNSVEYAQKKARYAAIFARPSKVGQDQVKEGNLGVFASANGFPHQGGLPIKVDGLTIGAVACSGAASEVDEAIAQAAIDALFKK
jgi:glc operon protein GlcG